MNVETLVNRLYGPDRRDNDVFFRRMIYEMAAPGARVLDAGAGAGELFPYDLTDKVGEVVGVDMDPRVERNPQVHRGICADLTNMPLPDSTFDLVFSRYVLEHVAEPRKFLGEIHRVLKPGGKFLFLTPNRWHYVSLAARMTPLAFHEWYNRRRGQEDEDVFPTFYRLNSAFALRRHLKQAGFREDALIFRECCPNYLTFALIPFLVGVAYERLVQTAPFLAFLRVNIIGIFTRQPDLADF